MNRLTQENVDYIYSFIIKLFFSFNLLKNQLKKMDKECAYIDDFQYHGLLGDGGQASVYLCSKNKALYAAKVYFAGHSKTESFKRQVEFLHKLNYKYLINVVQSNIQAKVKLPGKEQTTRSVIFLQFAEGGQLFDYIAKEGRFPAEVCRSLAKMMISAIEYLHSVGVAHRDLKPENILFDKDYNLKISDFGLSTMAEGHEGDGILYTKLGTQGYKPPEMEQGKYTGLQADLFAAGVILFVMYVGTPPFISTKNTDKIYKLIRDKAFSKFWALHQKKKPAGFFPDSFKRLINSFFSGQIQKRPTFESLKQDEWLNGDQAMQNDIYVQMSARYQRILANDENKQKIQKAKLQMYKSQMEQQCHEKDSNKQMCQDQQVRDLGEHLVNYQINVKQLPVSEKCNINSTQLSPGILISWLENYLKDAHKNSNIFLKDPIFPTTPAKYSFSLDEQNKKIQISLTFRVKDDIVVEDESQDDQDKHLTLETISIQGQLVQLKDGKVGIQWQNGNGNAFWVSSLVSELNSQIKVLV